MWELKDCRVRFNLNELNEINFGIKIFVVNFYFVVEFA